MFYEFDGIENFRDLGGLTRPDGARVKQGVLLRSGHLGHASAEDIRRLADMGLALVVDMRDRRERARTPDRAVPGAENIWLPPVPDLEAVIPIKSTVPREVRQVFHEFYRLMSLHPAAIEAYAAFFQKLLASGGRPVLWHCSQGKDRTGVGAMLLLSALGFDRETAIEEYLLTNQFAQKQLEGMRLARASEEELALMGEVFPVFEVNARYYFDCILIEYGSMENYLELALGLGPGEIARLREYYLQEETSQCRN